jgi:hypothetical protein
MSSSSELHSSSCSSLSHLNWHKRGRAFHCSGDQRPPFSNRGTSLRRRQTCRLGVSTIQTLRASSIILGAGLLNARFGVRRSLHSRSGLCFSRLKQATIVKRHLPVSRIAPEEEDQKEANPNPTDPDQKPKSSAEATIRTETRMALWPYGENPRQDANPRRQHSRGHRSNSAAPTVDVTFRRE